MLQNVLSDLLRDTIEHQPTTGFTGAGAPILGPAVAYPARVALKQRTVVDKTGKVAVSKSQVWFAASVAVALSDRIRLSDGSTPPILAIEHLPDDTGARFTKVYL